MMTAVPVSLATLIAETVWLRRLALALVKDAATADDVVQDTVMIAATNPPRDDRPLGPWLARVLLNRVRMLGRAASRRGRRERVAAELATGPATPEALVDRVQLQQLLADLVLALDPLLRDIVLLRYVEELSSAAIGRRLGIPDATVRWRLQRAIAELRARLDERAPRRAWLAPVAALGKVGSVPVGGATIFGAAAVLSIALLGILAWLVHTAYAPHETAQAHGMLASRSPSDPADRLDPALDTGATRAQASAGPTTWPRRLPIVVLDRAGAAVRDAELYVRCGFGDESPRSMRTGGNGRVEIDVDRDCALRATARRGTEIGEGGWYPELDMTELVLRLEPVPTVIIHVVDSATAAPIAGAALWAAYMKDAQPSAVTDASGVARLALDELAVRGRPVIVMRGGPSVPFPFGVDAPGYPSVDVELDLGSGSAIEKTVRLTRGITVSGRVVDGAGRGVAGARVIIENSEDVEARSTGDSGAFTVAVPRAGRYRARAAPADRARRARDSDRRAGRPR